MPRRCTCDRVRPGEPFDRSRDCRRCWNYHHVPAIHKAQGGTPETLAKDPRSCDCGCGACVPPPNPAPLSLTKITAADLGHAPEDWVSNASIVLQGGSWVLAYRRHWSGADTWVRRLDDSLRPLPGRSVMLDLAHPAAKFGREDPRWFWHDGRLHLAYAGVQGKAGPTQQLYARLRDDLTVEAKFAPRSPTGAAWEKNWGFFSTGPELFAVHSISPHVVVRIEGSRAAVRIHETPSPFPWSGGFLRGGASPVLVNDEYHVWFHGKHVVGKRMTYTTGVYTFEAEPPFRVLSVTPDPIMHGDPETRPKDWGINNWFPCGAVLDGDTWVVSAGAHDRWIEVARWDAGGVAAAVTGSTRPPPAG